MNQTSPFVKLVLVATCVSPVLIVYAFIAYTKSDFTSMGLFIAATLSLALMCKLTVRYFHEKGHRTELNVASFKAADKEVSGFFVSYLIPVISANDFFYNFQQGLFFIGLFFVFIWASKSYYANPILGIFGFKFYEISTESGKTLLLISKEDIVNTTQIKKITYLTQYTVITSKI